MAKRFSTVALSNAMLRGAKKRRKAVGDFFMLHGKKLGGSCALGAVYEATFGTPPIRMENWKPVVNGGTTEMDDRLQKRFPVLQEMVFYRPDNAYRSLNYAIVDLNDSCKWSREKIARWLRKVKRGEL